MSELAAILSGVGLAVVTVWAQHGPGARLRELARPVLDRVLPGMIDCLVCASFWTGLIIGGLSGHWWACLACPAVVWFAQGVIASTNSKA